MPPLNVYWLVKPKENQQQASLVWDDIPVSDFDCILSAIQGWTDLGPQQICKLLQVLLSELEVVYCLSLQQVGDKLPPSPNDIFGDNGCSKKSIVVSCTLTDPMYARRSNV